MKKEITVLGRYDTRTFKKLFGRLMVADPLLALAIREYSQWLGDCGISVTIQRQTFGPSLTIVDFLQQRSMTLLVRLSVNQWHHSYHRRCVKSFKVYVSSVMYLHLLRKLGIMKMVVGQAWKERWQWIMATGLRDSNRFFVTDWTMPSRHCQTTSRLAVRWLLRPCLVPTSRVVLSCTEMENRDAFRFLYISSVYQHRARVFSQCLTA